MVRIPNIPQGENGMYTYINTKEAKTERPHVHVSRGRKQRKGDLKFWLDSNSFVEETTVGFTESELRKLHAHLLIYWEDLMAKWVAVHGKPAARA